MSSQYDHKKIEQKWQKKWAQAGLFQGIYPDNEVDPENKMYILPQLPYPSGEGLHMGHAEVYTACDIYARYQRMRGKDVLQVIGWDAFGLPAENYAIKTGIHPRVNTNKAIDNFRKQIKSLGISVDWEREVGSHEPDYYKWTQWFFLLMYKRGLAYRSEQPVNWCSDCKTVLANEQVIKVTKTQKHENTKTRKHESTKTREHGNTETLKNANTGVQGKTKEVSVCERCGTEIVQKMSKQWFLRITDYADRLYEDLDKVDWPEESVKRQRDWIGKSSGALSKFEIRPRTRTPVPDRRSVRGTASSVQGTNSKFEISTFTTRLDTLYGATAVVIAPEKMVKVEGEDKHLALEIASKEQYQKVKKYIQKAQNKTELERRELKEKTGVFTGAYAVNPVNGEEIPVWVADYVIGWYGEGAIMLVPAHDERDYEFAQKYNIDIEPVIESVSNDVAKKDKHVREKFSNATDLPFVDDGVLVNSGKYTGLSSGEAREKILADGKKAGWAEAKTEYKLHDWSVSRQRFWGAPIPIIYCDECGVLPVPEEDLPVELPEDVDFKPTGVSPLVDSKEFHNVECPRCGAKGEDVRRESDTLDTFMCSSWYYYRYLDPHNQREFASKKALKNWMPVDFYIGGVEHVTGHLLYSRFFTKVLHDAGYVEFDEPFIFHRHQGTILGPDGRKMSKRWGNIINPTDVVEEYGADTARIYEMFMGPLEGDKPWDTEGVKGVRRFLERVWRLYEGRVSGNQDNRDRGGHHLTRQLHKTIKKVTEDIEELKFNTAIAALMEFVNEVYKFQFEVRPRTRAFGTVRGRGSRFEGEDAKVFLRLLAPFAPHLSEELWQKMQADNRGNGNQRKQENRRRSARSQRESASTPFNSIHIQKWPEYDPELVREDEVDFVVQVNGKVRATLVVDSRQSTVDSKMEKLARGEENVKRHLEGKKVKDVIFVPGKLLNFVTIP